MRRSLCQAGQVREQYTWLVSTVIDVQGYLAIPHLFDRLLVARPPSAQAPANLRNRLRLNHYGETLLKYPPHLNPAQC